MCVFIYMGVYIVNVLLMTIFYEFKTVTQKTFLIGMN